MKALGQHIVAELAFCNGDILGDLQKVQDIMVTAALEAKAEIREVAFHKFTPQGVSGVVVLAESHIAVHTWPEKGYAAVDIYTCGDTADNDAALRYMIQQFEAGSSSVTTIDRGVPTSSGHYGHLVRTTRDSSPRGLALAHSA